MSDAEDRAWVEEHREVVARAFQMYVDTGEWPKVADLRRFFAQRGQVLDVEAIANSRPRFAGEVRSFLQEALVLRIRQLRYLPIAQPLLQVCLAATRKAVEIYLTQGADPKVSSSDPQIAGMAGSDVNLLARAGPFLSADQPSPLSGGSYGSDAWEFFINEGVILDFQNLGTLDDFVRRQEKIAEPRQLSGLVTGGVPLSGMTSPVTAPVPLPDGAKRIFVIMPFGPAWSKTIYEMIQRAVQDIDLTPAAIVKRADDITNPGRITDQIIAEIRAADVVVADITGLNPNVMWELGYAQALDKPAVILNQDIHNSPFDLLDHRQIVYKQFPTSDDQRLVMTFLRSALGL
jgi:hypothetical protein